MSQCHQLRSLFLRWNYVLLSLVLVATALINAYPTSSFRYRVQVFVIVSGYCFMVFCNLSLSQFTTRRMIVIARYHYGENRHLASLSSSSPLSSSFKIIKRTCASAFPDVVVGNYIVKRYAGISVVIVFKWTKIMRLCAPRHNGRQVESRCETRRNFHFMTATSMNLMLAKLRLLTPRHRPMRLENAGVKSSHW